MSKIITSDHQSPIEAALSYAARGLPVVPIKPGSKAPLIEHGAHGASLDPSVIEGWWRRWPRADVALACGETAGFDVLDVDKQHGGLESLAAFTEAHGCLPKTARQITPSGGYHLLFRHQPGLKNWSGGQGTAPRGLDCRTNGTMIKTAPTAGYGWTRFIDPAELPPWPDCLVAFFQEIGRPTIVPNPRRMAMPMPAGQAQRYVMATVDRLADEIASAAPGCQQSTLNAASYRAGRLQAAVPDIDTDLVINELVAAGLLMVNQPGRDPWRYQDVDRIVRRAARDGQRRGPATLPSFQGRRGRRRTHRKGRKTERSAVTFVSDRPAQST